MTEINGILSTLSSHLKGKRTRMCVSYLDTLRKAGGSIGSPKQPHNAALLEFGASGSIMLSVYASCLTGQSSIWIFLSTTVAALMSISLQRKCILSCVISNGNSLAFFQLNRVLKVTETIHCDR